MFVSDLCAGKLAQPHNHLLVWQLSVTTPTVMFSFLCKCYRFPLLPFAHTTQLTSSLLYSSVLSLGC